MVLGRSKTWWEILLSANSADMCLVSSNDAIDPSEASVQQTGSALKIHTRLHWNGTMQAQIAHSLVSGVLLMECSEPCSMSVNKSIA